MRQVRRGVMVHDNPKLKTWMHAIELVAGRVHRGEPIDAPVAVEAVFYMPRPKRPRWSLPATKPDTDKLQRAVGDGLERAGVLKNDSRIVAWASHKCYADAQHPLGARIKVWSA